MSRSANRERRRATTRAGTDSDSQEGEGKRWLENSRQYENLFGLQCLDLQMANANGVMHLSNDHRNGISHEDAQSRTGRGLPGHLTVLDVYHQSCTALEACSVRTSSVERPGHPQSSRLAAVQESRRYHLWTPAASPERTAHLQSHRTDSTTNSLSLC